jgi:hypothetical protein
MLLAVEKPIMALKVQVREILMEVAIREVRMGLPEPTNTDLVVELDQVQVPHSSDRA